MTTLYVTNILIGFIIGLISWLANRLIIKLDRFEKTVEKILMSDVINKKDIEVIKSDVQDHEIRISKLEAE